MNRIVVVIILTAILISGCSTQNIKGGDPFSTTNQTPIFSLKAYKDPEKRSGNHDKGLTVVVAISGGGHRAGNFGVGALMALEKLAHGNRTYNVLKEVDYFSTVSGGGFAAGAYIASLFDHDDSGSYSFTEKVKNNVNGIKRNLERDYHGKLAEAITKFKSIGYYDRGDYLEREFDQMILGAGYRKDGRGITFADMFIPAGNTSARPSLPIWIANATIYENGSIFPFYPGAFEEYKVCKYTHDVTEFEGGLDYFQIPLSIGLKASASFPVVVPATTLGSAFDPKNPFIHLFDGGLADNLGISTAVRLLEESRNTRKVLILIDAYNGNAEPFSKAEGSPGALQIYHRATMISLDTWRIRHKWVTEQLIEGIKRDGEKIDVIYLSFEQAEEDTKKKVKHISTKFNISRGEQQALFDAARQAVEKKAGTIVKAVFGFE